MTEKLQNTRSTFLLRKEIERLETENQKLLDEIYILTLKLYKYEEPEEVIRLLPQA